MNETTIKVQTHSTSVQLWTIWIAEDCWVFGSPLNSFCDILFWSTKKFVILHTHLQQILLHSVLGLTGRRHSGPNQNGHSSPRHWGPRDIQVPAILKWVVVKKSASMREQLVGGGRAVRGTSPWGVGSPEGNVWGPFTKIETKGVTSGTKESVSPSRVVFNLSTSCSPVFRHFAILFWKSEYQTIHQLLWDIWMLDYPGIQKSFFKLKHILKDEVHSE